MKDKNIDWIRATIERLAVCPAVDGTPINPADNMCSPGRDEFYYAVGRDALFNVVQSMLASDLRQVRRVLDFPSGYGRVARYLRAAFPEAEFFFGDIWKEAVAECARLHNGTVVEVTPDLRQIEMPKVDLIFCGSLLTHFSEAKAIELLDFFGDHLEVGGIMLVSCCGRRNLEREKVAFNAPVFETMENLLRLEQEYFAGRYAFANYPGQEGYGRSFTPVSWFHTYILTRPNFVITRFGERSWDDNQDVVTIKRVS